MSLFYRISYLIGFMPWDKNPIPAALERIALGQSGRALDLGCGPGKDSLYLAQRGWKVTGVDGQPRAIARAKARAAKAGAAVDFLCGDVTRLAASGVSGPFDLLLDFGCFHGMSDEERARYGASAGSVAAPRARMLLLAFSPRSGGGAMGGPRGASREEVERTLGAAFTLESASKDTVIRLPPGNREAWWYELTRKS